MDLMGPLIFLLVGTLFAIIFSMVGIASGEWLFTIIGGGLGLIFAILGGYMLKVEIDKKRRRKEILREGQRVTAIIIDFKNGEGTIVNGNYPIDIIVECEFMGGTRQFTIPTGKYSEKGFPIGAVVDIAVLGVEAAIIEGTVRFISLENTNFRQPVFPSDYRQPSTGMEYNYGQQDMGYDPNMSRSDNPYGQSGNTYGQSDGSYGEPYNNSKLW